MKCKFCCRLLGEIPGLFLDFDADSNQGGDGIPLCPICLGTGIDLSKKSEFKELSNELRKLRLDSLENQISKKPGWKERLNKTNKRIIEIAKQVNQITTTTEKIKGCYGDELSKIIQE